jgi:DNA-binding response OmpR family regulator
VLLVANGHPPPDEWAEDEDWMVAPADAVDLQQRSTTLRRRALDRVYVDEDGVVTRAGRWAALSTIEGALFATLFRRAGETVSGAELAEAAWAGKAPTPGQVRAAVDRTRRKLRHLGIAVHRVRGRGHLLEVLPQVPGQD